MFFYKFRKKEVIGMPSRHTLRIKREYFDLLCDGKKTIEIRVGYPPIRRISKGDIVSFENYSKNDFDVIRISVYASFVEMLKSEPAGQILPGLSDNNVLQKLRSIYPVAKEKLGVYAIELKKKMNRKIIHASKLLLKNQKSFSSLLAMSYNATDWICEDYPNHFNWFWNKTVPDIFNGKRDIIACFENNVLLGVSFLKKENDERKICTFFVNEKFRNQGVATILLEKSFIYLETSKPLISLADHKISMFEKIIQKYDWQLTQILDKGYYNNTSKEYVYNGVIA